MYQVLAGRIRLNIIISTVLLTSLLFSGLLLAEEFRLGVGDVIKVTVYDNPDLTTSSPVNELGRIVFPLLGDVAVSGFTTKEIETKIAKRLSAEGLVRNPQVIVFLEQIKSKQVSILGQINKPGKYPITGTETIIDFIAVAGGLMDEAGEVVVLIRNTNGKRKVRKIDVGSLFLVDMNPKNLNLDIRVKSGDIIMVPRMDVFYIYGEVRKPGVFRLERGMTIVQALSVGGGLSDRGTQKGIRVKRRNKDGKVTELKVDLNELLQRNDVIYVKESLF